MEKKIINCPRCKQPTEYSTENSFRPFCSERCRLIDLGQWVEEEFKIVEQGEIEKHSSPEDNDLDGEDQEHLLH